MGFFDIFSRKRKNTEMSSYSTRGIGGAIARKTDTGYFGNYFAPIIARAGITTTYKDFTEESFKRLPADRIRKIISSANPLVAKAVADYADSIASGYTYTADRTQGDETLNTPAQKLLDDFIMKMKLEQGGLETILQEFGRDMFIHGAAFSELIIDDDLKTPLRLKTLSASTAVFRRRETSKIGEEYELGQDLGWSRSNTASDRFRSNTNGNELRLRSTGGLGTFNFVSLQDEPTVQYWPIQSNSNNPYGTPIVDPAVFSVIMLAGFMSSFREALITQVSPNMLVTVDAEKFRELVGNVTNSEDVAKKFQEAIKDIQEHIGKLQPGEVIVQGSYAEISGTFSNIGRSPLGSLKDIQDVIRRDLIVALQTQPILMGSNETVAETHAIEQMKNYGRLIKRSQKALNSMLTTYFNLILELNGYPRLAEFKLNYENAAQYRDQSMTYQQFNNGLLSSSQAEKDFVESTQMALEAGFIDQEEAQRRWDRRSEIVRQLDIIPRDL